MIKNETIAWVDIKKNRLFVFSEDILNTYPLSKMASVVYDIDQNQIKLGSDMGLTIFDRSTQQEVLLNEVSQIHDTNEYRSNDGGFCGDYQLLGFMHRERPDVNAGYIYRSINNSWVLLDSSIHIPNTFVEIEPSKILISDSLKDQIWLYELDLYGNVLDKSLWAQLEFGVAPDGGCIVGDYILIALWDGAAIAVFNREGTLLDRLPVPVPRPTNCKFDSASSRLWITSASEGLSETQVNMYPNSGNTLIYDLELRL